METLAERGEPGFEIRASLGGRPDAPIAPDSATCADCLRELSEPERLTTRKGVRDNRFETTNTRADVVLAFFGYNESFAGKAGLPAQHSVGADPRSVTNQDEVIELGAAADACFADSGAVDAGVCLNFDIIFQHGGSGLRHFVPRTILLFCETQAVPTDDRTIL